MSGPVYEWKITVLGCDTYGKVAYRTPATIFAPTKTEVTAKVRAAFGATYDDFRKFWSHDWTLISVREVRTDSTDSDEETR